MNIKRIARLTFLAGALAVGAGCSSPCSDACATFVNKAQDCGLGGPSGDAEIDACAEVLQDTFTDDACDMMASNIEGQSCEALKQSLCGDPSTASQYRCN
ncbi:hypothetical protein [Sorangium sp. So ce1389]|uniref:hypothetical protein n=1 Tax=Sorangium sp. So ce1389 TaxID=3133336 RepID=UPI003F5EC7E4